MSRGVEVESVVESDEAPKKSSTIPRSRMRSGWQGRAPEREYRRGDDGHDLGDQGI